MSCTPATVLKGSGNEGLEHMKQCFLLSCHLLSTIPLLLKRLYSQYVFLIPSPSLAVFFPVSFSLWHPFNLNPPSLLFRVPSRDTDSTHRVQNNDTDKRIGSWSKNMNHSQLKVYLITVELFSFFNVQRHNWIYFCQSWTGSLCTSRSS